MAIAEKGADMPFDVKHFYLGPSTLESGTEHSSSLHRDNMTLQFEVRNAVCDSSSASTMSLDISKSSATTPMIVAEKINEVNAGKSTIPASTPQAERFIAFGTIKLYRRHDAQDSVPRLYMKGLHKDKELCLLDLQNGCRNGWLFLEDFSAGHSGAPRLRVYILPEDVDRSNRGSLKDFRRVIKQLLEFMDTSADAWFGTAAAEDPIHTYETSQSQDEESLFYIFNTLRSPSPDLSSMTIHTYGYHAVSDAIDGNILGLRTDLYPYQRRSVAAMIQREADPAKLLDPRKTVFRDIFHKPFYLDIHDGRLLESPQLYNEPQGGILAETMGYGKTLICIALILATRGHYPKVPQERIDSLPYEPRERVGSLLAMAARRTKHEGLPWKAEFAAFSRQGDHYDACLTELSKYERAYAEPIFTPTTAYRAGKQDPNIIVHLCSATLVIVPPNLLGQWQQEIRKHTDEGYLDVLVLNKPSQLVPSWKELLTYDIVLITKSRFEQEYRDDDLHLGKSKRGDSKYRSPLTDVRWLRVVCDEGHGFAGASSRTNAMAMLDKMYIERRWVVSGTPSSTLHGIEVGLSTTTSSSTIAALEGPCLKSDQDSGNRRKSISQALQHRRAPTAHESESKDLERLRLICVNFLKLQPWANQKGSPDAANFKKYLSAAASDHGERRSSGILRDVLQSLIIRHRIEDIDTDLSLPALHNRVVYLEPSYHDKIALNMFALVLTSNYITSEREDEDYMFHPKNRKKFDSLVNNLRQATFHWVGYTEQMIRETIRIGNEYFDKHIDRISDRDGSLLTEALMNGERALGDSSWRAFSKLHEIGVYVSRFPKHARRAWALDEQDRSTLLLGTTQARAVQRLLKTQFGHDAQDSISELAGAGWKVMNAARQDAEKEQKQHSDARTSDDKQIGTIEEPKLNVKIVTKPSSPTKSSPSKASSGTPRKRKASTFAPSTPLSALSLASPDMSRTQVPPTRIEGFSSAKLTYLIDQLLIHTIESKAIIFYSSNNTAYWIAEALEMMHINFLIYANTLSVTQRNDYLALFNMDESIRVLLMDLKQASHGLHVAAASRVYIVAPIWDKGVESQAVKRAHRIGQTKDVYVETLILRGTFEEEMIRRRSDIDEHQSSAAIRPSESDGPDCTTTSEEQASDFTQDMQREAQPKARGKIKSLLDDRHMADVLKNISFLKFSKEEVESIDARIPRLTIDTERRMLFANVAPHLCGGINGENAAGDSYANRTVTDGSEQSLAQSEASGETPFDELLSPAKKVKTVGFTGL